MLKGVEADYDWSYFREWLVAGELPRVGGEVRTKDILLSRTLADKLLLGVGDKVEMLFVEPGEMPRRDRFKVAGVYESGMEEMDGVVVVTDIRNVRRLSEWGPDEISGYEILTRSLAGADTFARTLGRTLLYDDAEDSENLAVTSVRERYANIFDWLKAHDVNAAVVIVIMLVVAFFNMTSAAADPRAGADADDRSAESLRDAQRLSAAHLPLAGGAGDPAGAGVGQCRRTGVVPRAEMDASGEAQLRGIPALGGARVAGLGLVAGAQRGVRRRDRRPAGDPDGRGLHREARRND